MQEVHQSKSEIWRRHIELAEGFPGSAREYCERHALQVQSFYQWRKKLFGLSKSKRRSFVPVVVSRLEAETLSSADLPDARWAAEFVGYLLRGLR